MNRPSWKVPVILLAAASLLAVAFGARSAATGASREGPAAPPGSTAAPGRMYALNPLVAARLKDATGRQDPELLDHLVGCALGEGESIGAEVNGEQMTLPGRIGLAPGWVSGTMTAKEQRWMTACLLARTNAFGEKVLISMRGEHPSLRSGAGSRGPGHPVQEGAFYGNILTDRPVSYACLGDHEGGASPDLVRRVCAEGRAGSSTTPCGFLFAGRCADVCRVDEQGGYYHHCRGGEEIYEEVITVYLAGEGP